MKAIIRVFKEYPYMIIFPMGLFMITVRWLEAEPVSTLLMLLALLVGFGMVMLAWLVVVLARAWQKAYLKGLE